MSCYITNVPLLLLYYYYFIDILNIDHLWMLKSLVKLTLSHNIIERIENLDELVHLRELDLSFNRIKVMENLNNLEQLEILLLFSNEIVVVQGISNLKKLSILNIGKNKITDWEHVRTYNQFLSSSFESLSLFFLSSLIMTFYRYRSHIYATLRLYEV